MKVIKYNFFPLVIVSLITVGSWYKILFQAFTGEGYWYFFYSYFKKGYIFRFDTGAELLFDFLPKIFKDNLFFYQLFALLALILLGGLFYLVVFEFSRKRMLAFISTMFFCTNYGILYEMVGRGDYGVFIQRTFFFLFIFPSYIFYIRFLNTEKNKYLFFSFGFYSLALLLAHFSVFFAPFFMTYILGLFIVKKMPIGKKIILFLKSLSLPTIGLLVLYADLYFNGGSYLSGKDFISYVAQNINVLLVHIQRQFVILTIPDYILNMSFSIFNFHNEPINFFYLPVLFLYLLCSIYIWFTEYRFRPHVIASVLFMPIAFTLNMFMRSEEVMYITYGSRYLFVPGIAFAIFWGMFFYSLLKNKYLHFFALFFLISFFTVQIVGLSRLIDEDQYKHEAIKKSLTYIKQLSPHLADNAFVVVPSILGPYGANFAQLYYGKKSTVFIPMSVAWDQWEIGLRHSAFDPKKDKILNYDYTSSKVIDRTNEYKEILEKKKAEK